MWTSREMENCASFLTGRDSQDWRRVITSLERTAGLLADQAETIRRDVDTTSVAHVENAFPRWLCDIVDTGLRDDPRIVTERVDTPNGRWSIDLIDNSYQPIGESDADDPFSVLCLSPAFTTFLADATGFTEKVVTTRRWVNRYAEGDAIAPHDDTTGDFQVMICLSAPPSEFGGTLVLENGTEVDLQQGSVLVMQHAGLVHWTTPIASGAPRPRATATCRYYVENGRLPHSKVLPHTVAGPRTGVRSGGA
ncbi:hypothetical protein [Streptomyces sp. VNUA24]|uniref:hypothetical protein n=1 Tax=Streptomyces sp. VNUA24 TaxID=3031131 RepID=UPI0023B7B40A|nr:hypothetical protein [Streptomyces sp. VNUA24]WEH12240.1 hypothetical protein PYR72_00370 [Streptomyces sp. VNUA24]